MSSKKNRRNKKNKYDNKKNRKNQKRANTKSLLQNPPAAAVEPEEKNQQEKPSVLPREPAWYVRAVLDAVIAVCVTGLVALLAKQFWVEPPSLAVSENSLRAPHTYRVAVTGDTGVDQYLAVGAGQTGLLSFKLTNNEESALVVNNIYLEVLDYQPNIDIISLSDFWTGEYSTVILYGVQLDDMCKKYKCMLLDQEGATYFMAHHGLPPEADLKLMGETISGNGTDEIEVIFSPLHPGKYRFKIIIDYTIRKTTRTIESEEEFSFISLDPDAISQT